MEIAHWKRLTEDQKTRAVYCGRPSVLGNPFRLEKESDRESLLAQYREYLTAEIENGNTRIIEAIKNLKHDSVLACWCYPKGCHCKVIIEFWEKLSNRG